jgi:hypothetical protein
LATFLTVFLTTFPAAFLSAQKGGYIAAYFLVERDEPVGGEFPAAVAGNSLGDSALENFAPFIGSSARNWPTISITRRITPLSLGPRRALISITVTHCPRPWREGILRVGSPGGEQYAN